MSTKRLKCPRTLVSGGLSDDNGPLELAAHKTEVEGAITAGLDVTAIGSHEADAGVGRLMSIRLGCRKNRPCGSHIHQKVSGQINWSSLIFVCRRL